MKKSIKNLMGGVAAVTLCAFLAACGGGGGGGSAATPNPGGGGFTGGSTLDEFNNLQAQYSFTWADDIISGYAIRDEIGQVATATGNRLTVSGMDGKIVQSHGNANASGFSADVGNYTGGGITLNLDTVPIGETFEINSDNTTYVAGEVVSNTLVPHTHEIFLHRGGTDDKKFVMAELFYDHDGVANRFVAGGFYLAIEVTNAVASAPISEFSVADLGYADFVDMGVFLDTTPFTGYSGNVINSSNTNVTYAGRFASFYESDSVDEFGGEDSWADNFYGDVSFTVDFSDSTGGELTGVFTNITDSSDNNVGVRFNLGSTTWNAANRAFNGTGITCDVVSGGVATTCSIAGNSSFHGIFGGGGTSGAEPNYFSGTFGIDGLAINVSQGLINGTTSGDIIGIFDSEKQ